MTNIQRCAQTIFSTPFVLYHVNFSHKAEKYMFSSSILMGVKYLLLFCKLPLNNMINYIFPNR
uniref:Uncharacterized protein n=1 Tax=Rhizophora mucronata TaxID=61149 RepID=A0A2P2KUS2_RHIMU